ncbi:hypothetical protein CXG81DRAFT_23270 [Caulochytrium protostelioides]|uniref:Uncharacterized protein n=1 Tax=Caulochytrium protostelioides TaxID=1555241 RepID=A0A4P9XF27_9FUNG|nr:hypothetical protein CXG81DRAFT_23270 [Caulochytrium protostelioides]|eukprot:RKP04164.1 hypothetical protein CXG81DRAFT_23270 [Caulochytrium protostelioides]
MAVGMAGVSPHLEQEMAYVQNQLRTLAANPPSDLAACFATPQHAEHVVHLLFGLLQERQRAQARATESAESAHDLQRGLEETTHALTQCQQQLERSRADVKRLTRACSMAQEQYTQAAADLASAQDAAKRATGQLAQLRTQHHHDVRKRDGEIEVLKAKIRKGLPSAAAVQIDGGLAPTRRRYGIHPATGLPTNTFMSTAHPAMNGSASASSAAATPQTHPDDSLVYAPDPHALFDETLQQQQEREHELVLELTALKQFCFHTFETLAEMAESYARATATATGEHDGDGVTERERLDALHRVAPSIPADAYQLPFHLVEQNLNQRLHVYLATMHEMWHVIQATPPPPPGPTPEETATRESLEGQIRVCKEIIRQQEQVVANVLQLQEQFAQQGQTPLPYTGFAAETIDALEDLEGRTERLAARERRLQEERDRFTEAAIRLGKERVHLDRERAAFASHERTIAVLADLARVTTENPPLEAPAAPVAPAASSPRRRPATSPRRDPDANAFTSPRRGSPSRPALSPQAAAPRDRRSTSPSPSPAIAPATPRAVAAAPPSNGMRTPRAHATALPPPPAAGFSTPGPATALSAAVSATTTAVAGAARHDGDGDGDGSGTGAAGLDRAAPPPPPPKTPTPSVSSRQRRLDVPPSAGTSALSLSPMMQQIQQQMMMRQKAGRPGASPGARVSPRGEILSEMTTFASSQPPSPMTPADPARGAPAASSVATSLSARFMGVKHHHAAGAAGAVSAMGAMGESHGLLKIAEAEAEAEAEDERLEASGHRRRAPASPSSRGHAPQTPAMLSASSAVLPSAPRSHSHSPHDDARRSERDRDRGGATPEGRYPPAPALRSAMKKPATPLLGRARRVPAGPPSEPDVSALGVTYATARAPVPAYKRLPTPAWRPAPVAPAAPDRPSARPAEVPSSSPPPSAPLGASRGPAAAA